MKILALLSLCATLAGLAPSAAAQGYPDKPIRMVVGYSPGGAADVIARILATYLQRQLGQTVQVDNRPGAGSTLGSEIVARAPADGYTLLLGTAALFGLDQHLYKVRYTPADFTPINLAARSPLILAVSKNLGPRAVAELRAHAKANPGKLNYAHAGFGAAPHVAGIDFGKAVGVPMTDVPYKGGAPALQAVAAGDVQLSFGIAASVLPLGQQGLVRMPGVTSLQRSSVAPDLLPLAEQGLPGFEHDFWFGLFGPAKLPLEVRDKLFAATTRAANDPAVKAGLQVGGNEAQGSRTPAEFGDFARASGRASLERAVQAGVKLELGAAEFAAFLADGNLPC
jgi:tripartite-type tricarboxylate transporter receptor subunit TctC